MGLFNLLFGKKKRTYPTEMCAVCRNRGWTFPNENREELIIYAIDEELLDTQLLRCPTCGVFLHNKCADTVQEPSGETYCRCPICGKRL